MKRHFLQSEEWEKFQVAQGKEVVRKKGKGWEFMATVERTAVGCYLYVPYGPTVKDLKGFTEAMEELRRVAREVGAVFVRIEPREGVEAEDLKQMGMRKIKEVNPEYTWVLDLQRSEEEILAGMKQNNRNLWRNHREKGLTVRRSDDVGDLEHLSALLCSVAKNNRVSLHEAEYLRRQMEMGIGVLYLVELEGGVIAASMVYDWGGVRYYAHAAADYGHRKLAAGTVLVAQMIMDAKEAEMKEFDFYGVYAGTDEAHPWYGFSRFKKSFGGELRSYLGTWDLPMNRVKYGAFGQLRRANRAVRKLKNRVRK